MPKHALFDPDLSQSLELRSYGSWPKAQHRFEPRSVHAVQAAIAAERPLLVRGEPGIGKSQLARAVAQHLRVPFLPFVVDERSERDELLCKFDAVARLAQAQVSALELRDDRDRRGNGDAPDHENDDWRSKLAEANFVQPGVLWWAIHWGEAESQVKQSSRFCHACEEHEKPDDWTPAADRACGPVVLIDEIDKADPSVPNGLLECLGNHGFYVPQLGKSIRPSEGEKPPLVIITTNEDRELPPAFLRRCLVLQLHFPEHEAEAKQFLLHDRARVCWKPTEVSDAVCTKVAEELWAARQAARHDGRMLPGAAEYLDILRVLVKLSSGNDKAQLEALQDIADFALRKQRDEFR